MDAEDHSAADEERRSLAEASGAILERQQGDEVSGDFRQC